MDVKISILWILTSIHPIYNEIITTNSLEMIFNVFFVDDSKICYISAGNETDNDTININKEHVGELWLNVQSNKNFCSDYKNFVIFVDDVNSFDALNQLDITIPSLSKILIISKQRMTKSRELRIIALENNWDIIIYHEEKQIFTNPKPLRSLMFKQYSICLPTRILLCNRNIAEIPNFLENRPKWSPKRMLRALNRPLKVAIIQNPPYIIINNEGYVTGVEIETLRIIFEYPIEFKVLNLKPLSKIPVSENPWGNITKALIVKNGGSDIAVSSLWMRKYDHDMTYPLEQQCITFIVKRPVLFSESWFVFENLSLELWGLDGLLLVFIITIFSILQSGLLREDFFPRYEKGKTVLDVLRTFAGSSMSRNIYGNYQILRFLFLLWLLFCLIMVTCYNAGLTTSLKYPKLTKNIENIKDMIDQKIRWMDETDGVADLIHSSNESTARALWQLYESEPNKTYRNYKLERYNYGFRIDRLPGGYIRNLAGVDQSILRQFQILNGCYTKNHLVIGLKRNSPLKKFFDGSILRLAQHGILDYLYRKFALMRKSEAMFQLFKSSKGERGETLNFQKLEGAFCMLLVGLLLGLVAFVYEYCFRRI